MSLSKVNLTRREALAAGIGAAGALALSGVAKVPTALACEDEIPGGDHRNGHSLRSASIIVAASNAPERWKDAADYVCTGSNDDVVLSAALGSMDGRGGRAVFSEGDFYTSAPVTLPGMVSIQGQGRVNTTIHGAGLILAYRGSTVHHLGISGGGYPGSGIVISGNSRYTLSNLYLGGMGQHGLDIQLSNLIYLEQVRCDGNGGDGIHIYDPSPGAPDVMAGTAVNLDLINNSQDGLNIVNGQGWNMVGVTAQQNGQNGIHIQSGRNYITGWAESNGGADILLDTYSRGNVVQAMNTHTPYGTITDLGAFNMVLSREAGTTRVSWANLWARKLSMVGPMLYASRISFPNGNTTPSVAAGNYFRETNPSPITISDFADGGQGQQIIVDFDGGNATVRNSVNGIRLQSGQSYKPKAGTTMTFINDGTRWREVSRSENG